jgi:hypothetical protein
MSIFKDKSRFSSLIDDSFGKKKDNTRKELHNTKMDFYNSFKNDKPHRENYYKSYKERSKEIMERIEKEQRFKKEEDDALAIESFPEFVILKTNVIEKTTTFLDKLKKNVKIDIPVKNTLKLGWTEFTLDKLSNSTVMFSNIKINEYIKTSQDLSYDIVDKLVCLYEKRKDEYINYWGEDEWEQMFTFKNYDYHYFDKLDDIYEKNNHYEDTEDSEDFEDEYWNKY